MLAASRTATMLLSRRRLLSSASIALATTPSLASRSYATARKPPSSSTIASKPTRKASSSSTTSKASAKTKATPSPAATTASSTATTATSSDAAAKPTPLASSQTESATTPSDPTEPPITNASPTSNPTTTESPFQATADLSAPPPSSTPPSTEISRQSSLAESFLDYTEVVANPNSTAGSTFPGSTTGAKAKGAGSKSSIEKKRANLTRFMLGLTSVALVYSGWSLGKPWENEEEKVKLCGRSEDLEALEDADRGGLKGWLARTRLRGADQLDYLNKPAWDPLLPPPMPEPHYRPYTLVIDLDDMLVHASWDVEHGWRTAKRPGVNYFLAYLSQFYEIVLFTTQPGYTAAPIVEKLDPYGAYIPWKLFRESTRYKNKALIKDLSYLGRPLERTIILDTNPEHVQLQKENAILLEPWHGSKNDATSKELVALIPFLEALAVRGVQDVRPIIKHYEGKHIPTAYAEVEAKLKQELVDKWQKERERNGHWMTEAFGGLTKNPRSDQPPETDIERVRKNAQKIYLEEQKYWKDNEEAINKQIEEDKQRQLKEMKSSLLSFMGIAPPSNAGPDQQPGQAPPKQ